MVLFPLPASNASRPSLQPPWYFLAALEHRFKFVTQQLRTGRQLYIKATEWRRHGKAICQHVLLASRQTQEACLGSRITKMVSAYRMCAVVNPRAIKNPAHPWNSGWQSRGHPQSRSRLGRRSWSIVLYHRHHLLGNGTQA